MILKCNNENKWINLEQLSDDEFNNFIDHTFVCEYHDKMLEDFGKDNLSLVGEAFTLMNRELETADGWKISHSVPEIYNNLSSAIISIDLIARIKSFLDEIQILDKSVAILLMLILIYSSSTFSQILPYRTFSAKYYNIAEIKPDLERNPRDYIVSILAQERFLTNQNPDDFENKELVKNQSVLVTLSVCDDTPVLKIYELTHGTKSEQSVRIIPVITQKNLTPNQNLKDFEEQELMREQNVRITFGAFDDISVIKIYDLMPENKKIISGETLRLISKTIIFRQARVNPLMAVNVESIQNNAKSDKLTGSDRATFITKNKTYPIPAKYGLENKTNELENLISSLVKGRTYPVEQKIFDKNKE